MKKEQIYQAVEDATWPDADPRAGYGFRHGDDGPVKIMPKAYQADGYRKFSDCVLVIDDFVDLDLLEQLQTSGHIVAQTSGGWSRTFGVTDEELTLDSRQLDDDYLSTAERLALEGAIDKITAKVHGQMMQLTQDYAITRYNTWVNTGSIRAGKEDFHFWHYDSDEYIESCMPQNWVRFPIWGAIFYINEPMGETHYTVFDDNRLNQKIRSVTNRLVIFDPSLMHKVIGTHKSDSTKDTRLVMVFNAWDYDAPDSAIHIDQDTRLDI